MKIITYDCEVFAHNWLVTFKDKETGEYTCIWDDNEALKACMDDESIYIGFNSKHYDQFIIKAIASDFSPEEVKKVNDYIIGGGQGWEYPELKGIYYRFNNVDIRDDMQAGLSLKSIEGHLGLPIEESSVPFDIERPLTDDEKRETEHYCKHDVDTTEELIDIRKDYLKNKIHIGKMADIPEAKAIAMTNAKLTAAILKAEKKHHDDEREYTYPDNLKREYIPNEVFEFFDRMKDKSIPDEELFSGKLNLMIGECPVTIGYGGIHGAIPHYFWEESDTRGIWNEDVGSYYPHLCTINGYTSRNIPSPKVYENILETRMKAKADGDKATSNALKLVCNTTYGCLLNQYNDLYDPLMGRSVCISGQLYLLELAEHCYKDIENLKIIQLNTDGIMVECDKKDYPELTEICNEWQKRTGFDLEEDTLSKLAQKDVNNYIEIQSGGAVKSKGGYLVKGIAPAGAFNVNNSCVIVATALREYLSNGTPVEDTINNCDDLSQFQIIAKGSSKYKEVYQLVDGEKVPTQKVNRVYATSEERYGKLYKVKKEDDSIAKIENLPEHCIIDNTNQLCVSDIDKTYYIELAKKRIQDFKGIEDEKPKTRRKKKMATAKQNVYQKLITAREMFLNENVEKSGKNMHLSFKYFELEDIVPSAIRIFKKVGLLSIYCFTKDYATMEIHDVDNPEDAVVFGAPFNQVQPIISSTKGTKATNEMQALGASITYMRRYLYMIALDICENDTFDAEIGEPVTNKQKSTVPMTSDKRQEVKRELTNPEEKASDLQVKGLKNVLKKLKDKDPSKEEMIAKIAIQTDGFKNISKADCESLIERITGMMEGK